MALFLHIDTALDVAFAGISQNGQLLASAQNNGPATHAAWLHVCVNELLQKTGVQWNDFDAVSVNRGPGSYTGLRVGMAAAKGYCFAANKPLITVSCTELLARAVPPLTQGYICAMIDARRMEVFAAVYTYALQTLREPEAVILDNKSFYAFLNEAQTVFCGNGSAKFKTLCTHPNAIFSDVQFGMNEHVAAACWQWENKRLADVAYVEPEYGKPAYTTGLQREG